MDNKLELLKKALFSYLAQGEFEVLDAYNGLRQKVNRGDLVDYVLQSYHPKSKLHKPILRPLSDLTKEIEVNGERFVPIVELLKLAYPKWFEDHKEGRYSIVNHSSDGYPRAWVEVHATVSIMINTSFIEDEKYWIVQKLYEWKFDVKNLIGQNLSVDINALK